MGGKFVGAVQQNDGCVPVETLNFEVSQQQLKSSLNRQRHSALESSKGLFRAFVGIVQKLK